MLHPNCIYPGHRLFTLTLGLALAACSVADKELDSGSSGGATGTEGIGQSNTSASDPSSPFDTTTGINEGTGEDEPPMTTSTAAPDETTTTTGALPTSATADDGTDTEPQLFDMPCGGGTVEQFQDGDWQAALANHDPDVATPVTCTTPPTPSALPIPELAQALVIRNDALPLPKDFVPPNARWMLWSNIELGCADPFAVPLCEGQWRVSLPLAMQSWCELRILEEGPAEHGISFDPGYPFWMEVGDANCETQVFGIGPENGFTTLRFNSLGDLAPSEPQPGELRADCAVPGITTPLRGTFSAEVCPG